MANKIGFYKIPNTTATSEDAAYTMRAVPVGVCNYAEITNDIVEKLGGSVTSV